MIMNMEDNSLLWQLGSIVVAALVMVIGTLWKMVLREIKERRDRSDRLEKEVLDSKDKIIELHAQVGLVKGRQEGIESLARRVIEEVRSLKSAD